MAERLLAWVGSLLALTCLAPLPSRMAAEEPPAANGAQPDAVAIDRLIRLLGSEEFDQREAASRALERYGEGALGALRRAEAASPDAEVRRRAERLVGVIEE